MTLEGRPQLAAVGEALPAALLVWKLGARLLRQAEQNPQAQRWARIGASAAALLALAAVAVAFSNAAQQRQSVAQAAIEDRLDDELADSFPASDAPSLSRGGTS